MKYFFKFIGQVAGVIMTFVSMAYLFIFIIFHTLAIEKPTTGPITYFWLPFICIFIVMTATYFWGKWTRDEEASARERRIDGEIKAKYNTLVDYINLAKDVTSKSADEFVKEWIENRRKKEGLSDDN